MPPASYDNRERGGSASEFEDELAAVSQEDERALAESAELEQQYALEMEEQQNRERTQNRLQQLAGDAVKSEAKALLKTEAKAIAGKVAKSAAMNAARSAAIAAAPWVGGALLIIGAIILIVVVAFVVLDYKCNQTGAQGYFTRLASTIAAKMGYVPEDACKVITRIKGSVSTATPAPVAPDPAGADSDLVSLSGFPLSNVSNPQVRACMLPGVTYIMQRAQAAGLTVVITSAYRPGVNTASGGVSAHARGEAVDFALRPVGSLSDPAFQQQIRTLVQIARDEGFDGVQGDTLDEYNNPADNATGGHVHVEFNAGFCDQQFQPN